MQIRLTLAPGKRGTQKYVTEYGDRLVCVRYRYDETKGKRYKTIELIVDEIDWPVGAAQDEVNDPDDETLVQVKVEWGEWQVGLQVKQAGGIWKRKLQVWEVPYGKVKALGLQGRVVGRVE